MTTNMLLDAANMLTRASDGKTEQLTTTMTFAERAAYCLERTLIGLIIVFGVLAIIWGVLAISKFFFTRGEKKPKKEEAPAVPAEAVSAVPETDDGEIVAAIIAAISVQRADEGKTGGFRVVSFKRGGKAQPWNQK